MNKKELESLKIMELRSYAREHGVSLRRDWTKSDIIAAIVRVTQPKRGRKPKPTARRKVKAVKALSPVSGRKKVAAGKPKAAAQRKVIHRAASGNAEGRGAGIAAESSSPAGQGSITLMAQDERTLFIHWDVSGAGSTAADAADGDRLRIRLWDLAKTESSDCYDMEASGLRGSRYLKIGLPDHHFACEIGINQGNGRFYKLASSKTVRTPPDRMASIPEGAERFYQENFGLEPGEVLKLGQLNFVSSGS